MKNDLAFIKETFLIRDDEKIIFADDDDGVEKFFAEIQSLDDKGIFFIVIPNFRFDILTDNGFVHGRDFLNGMEFLSEEQGLPINSYPLIQAM